MRSSRRFRTFALDARCAVAAASVLIAVSLAADALPLIAEPLGRSSAFAVAGWRIRRLVLPALCGAGGALAAFVFAVSSAVVLATVLGTLGILTSGAANAALAGLLLVLSALRRGGVPDASVPVAAGGSTSGSDPAERREVLVVAMCVAVAVSTLAFDTRGLITRPPGSFGHDDLSYHLTAVATWRQSGDLRMSKPNVGDLSTPFYPIAGELVSWWLLLPGRGADYLARWSELPAAAGLLLALFALAPRIGVSRGGASLAAGLLLTVPRIYPELAHSAGNDLWTAVALLAALHALLVSRAPSTGAALYLGSAFGLLVGTKYLGLIHAAVVLAVATVGRWRLPPRTSGVAAATAAAVGGFAYLRNLAGTGNPVFPQPVKVLGFELLRGLPGADLLSRAREEPPGGFEAFGFLADRIELFGPLARWTLLPAALLAPLVAAALSLFRRPGSGDSRAPRAWLLLPAVLYATFVFVVPDHRDLRYFVSALALAALAAGWLVDRCGRTIGSWLALTGVSALALHLLADRAESRFGERVGSFAVLAIALVTGASAGSRRAASWARWVAVAVIVLTELTAFGSGRHLDRYLERRYANFPAAEVFERRTAGLPVVVAVAGSNQEYPFFGRSLQNRVEPLPTVAALEDGFWSFGRSPVTRPAGGADRGLPGRLETLGVEWLVVRQSAGVGALERSLRSSRRWRLVELHRDWHYWRRATESPRRADRQGVVRLHQSVVPDSKPSE